MQMALKTACFLEVPENRAALFGVSLLVGAFAKSDEPHLLFLHGRPGMGKSRLARRAIDEIQTLAPQVTLSELSASELTASAEASLLLDATRQADFLVIEDLQHLAPSFVEAVIDLLDERDAEGRYTLVTANSGPRDLSHRGGVFPARLRSRLAAALVIALEPLSLESRAKVLEQLTQGLHLEPDGLVWLGRRLSTWREIEGAATQLKALAKDEPLTLSAVRSRFDSLPDLTAERIAERVADYFALNLRALKSQLRARRVLLARQISMYLARRLTKLSLESIGRYFGGRDHSTVLHACAKVENVLATPSELAGAIRQLEAELA